MTEEKAAPVAVISEQTEAHRKIPKVVFIDNAEAWVDKYGDDALFQQMNELYQKYKFMETQLARGRQNFKVKLPDIYRGILPFIVIEAIVLALLLAFPDLSLWLPRQMFN